MKENISISVENVSKIYNLYDSPADRLKEAIYLGKKCWHKEYLALDNINFQIQKGETVGIIGTNGAGKSTLLKLITGVANPSTGSINVNGKISALLELGAGFNIEYTGLENIYLSGIMMGYTKEEVDKKVNDILAFADIGNFIYQPVKTYSSGMFARLAFAVAINVEPDILIVDEALSVGDIFFQAKCYKKFEEFKNEEKTILFVSHDLGSISKYCDRVILLDKGKKIEEGLPSQMIDLYKKILVDQLNSSSISKENNKEQIENDWKKFMIVNPYINEYGNGMAKIIDYGIFDERGNVTNTIAKGQEFSIKMKVEFFTSISDPIFAFTITDLRGTDITGTNTMLEKTDIPCIKVGNTLIIHFKQKMNLQGGEYLLQLGCTGYQNGEFVVYHRLYDLCNITVIAEKNSVGFYDMNSVITLEQRT